MSIVQVHRGTSPIILGFPHVGTHVPSAIWDRLNETGRQLADTDWHVDRLYDGLLDGATTVSATTHRYVIDVNRDPNGMTLYPGQNTTDLVPATDFDGRAIWRNGAGPTAEDITLRLRDYHAPYHAALAVEVDRVRSLHGLVLLYDCHSIRSRCAYLFDGVLPDFNIGTDRGRTCDHEIEDAAFETAAAATDYSSVLNGRFQGGWTTRHYGRPKDDIHAVQMEIAQRTYLESEALPFALDEAKTARLRPHLKAILTRLEATLLNLTRE